MMLETSEAKEDGNYSEGSKEDEAATEMEADGNVGEMSLHAMEGQNKVVL